MVATREVGAPDGAREQHVADDREAIRLVDEHDVARRVPGAVEHLQCLVPDRDRVAIVQPARGLKALAVGETEHPGLLRHLLDPELVRLVRTLDRQRVTAREFRGGTGVVEVGVGDQDLLELQSLLAHHVEHEFEVAAGIDDRSPEAALAPDD